MSRNLFVRYSVQKNVTVWIMFWKDNKLHSLFRKRITSQAVKEPFY